MGPVPVTSTRCPISEPARRAACRQTASGSAKAAMDSVMPGGTGTACAWLHTSTSRKPPSTCGVRMALP